MNIRGTFKPHIFLVGDDFQPVFMQID